jgi:hypothetical protein
MAGMIPEELPAKMLRPMFVGAVVTVVRRALSPPGPPAPEIVLAVDTPPAPSALPQPRDEAGLGRGLGNRFVKTVTGIPLSYSRSSGVVDCTSANGGRVEDPMRYRKS